MRAIYRREMQSFFYTAAAYVFMLVFLTLGSVFFIVGNLNARSGNLLNLMAQLSYLWMLLSPVLTMKLLAAERRQRTDQLLFSSPCSLTSLVTGKYLAACTVLFLTLAATLVYVLIVAIYGTLYLPETLTGYLGLLLQGCAFLALDLFVSSFARSQMTAAVLGLGANLLIFISDVAAAAISAPFFSGALKFLSLYQRFSPFARGQMSFSNVLFYCLFIFVMLFLTVRVLDARRWKEG